MRSLYCRSISTLLVWVMTRLIQRPHRLQRAHSKIRQGRRQSKDQTEERQSGSWHTCWCHHTPVKDESDVCRKYLDNFSETQLLRQKLLRLVQSFLLLCGSTRDQSKMRALTSAVSGYHGLVLEAYPSSTKPDKRFNMDMKYALFLLCIVQDIMIDTVLSLHPCQVVDFLFDGIWKSVQRFGFPNTSAKCIIYSSTSSSACLKCLMQSSSRRSCFLQTKHQHPVQWVQFALNTLVLCSTSVIVPAHL